MRDSLTIYKERLPTGWSYGLKPPELEKAIAAASIEMPISLHQKHKIWAAEAPALSATYHPPGSFLRSVTGHISITSCAVKSEQQKATQAFSDSVFIPALIKWVASIEAMPANSTYRREEQEFACEGAPFALNASMRGSVPKGQRRKLA